MIKELIDFVLHIDTYLGEIIQNYGALTYLILFVIIFCETGLVITPFLPGDSLLFVAGTFAAAKAFNVLLLFLLLGIAAIAGDSINYFIGNYFGERVFAKSRLFKPEYLQKTKEFYRKYGTKTIIIARFIPIIRTFAPFVAGVGKMSYSKFLIFNITGGIAWTALFIFAGYFFGNIPIVRDNLTLVIFAIIFISILPAIIEYLRHRKKK